MARCMLLHISRSSIVLGLQTHHVSVFPFRLGRPQNQQTLMTPDLQLIVLLDMVPATSPVES